MASNVTVTEYKGSKIMTSKDEFGWNCFTHRSTGSKAWVWGDYKSEEDAIEAGKKDVDQWDYETTKV